MQEFYARRFFSLMNALFEIEKTCEEFRSMTTSIGEMPEVTKKVLDTLNDDCQELGLDVSQAQVEKIIRWWTNYKPPELKNDCEELRERITDECKNRLFMHIPRSKVPYYREPSKVFGKEISDKFYPALYDIEEAGKCYAAGRDTACVFHLMRIMEAGLRYLCSEAASFGISMPDPDSNRNWSGWLDPLEKEFRKDRKLKTPDWNALEPTYAQVTSHIRTVSTAWRNPTMHVGAKYTVEEAEDIFNAVRGFMRHLATAKLKK